MIKKSVKFLSLFLVAITLLSVIPFSAGAAVSFPSLSENSYAEWTATKNINGYRYSNFSSRGTYSPAKTYNAYIEKGDVVRIIYINSSYAKVRYPVGSSYKYTYVRTKDILSTSSASEKVTSANSVTTYKYTNGTKSGSISKNDTVYKLSVSGSYIMVMYTAVSGARRWKIAYVKTSDYNSKVKQSYNPTSYLDSVTSTSANKITVVGWTFDKDSLSTALNVHVYIGGPAGSGAPGYSITADKYRSDVHKAYGCGNYHGFSSTISVPSSYVGKNTTIYVYAINVGGGANTLIGTKNVTIKGNVSSPSNTFSPIWPCKSAYTVTCMYYYKDGTKHSTRYGYKTSMDIGGGGDIVAVEKGVVITVADLGNKSFGKYVEIKHDNGKISLYAHLKSINVSKGQSVAKGHKIGQMGNTGNSGGTHLHFELSNSDPFMDYYKNTYAKKVVFENNVYSNNKNYNSDKTICNIISSNYRYNSGYYYAK